MVCNAVMSAGMAHLAGLIEGGMSHRDAVAQVYKDAADDAGGVADWKPQQHDKGTTKFIRNKGPLVREPEEGCSHLELRQEQEEPRRPRRCPWVHGDALLFEDLKIYTVEETEARQEVETMIQMTETGILPACAKDLEKYKGFEKLGGNRKAIPWAIPVCAIYDSILEQLDKLKTTFDKKPHSSLAAEATYLCDTIKPQMVALRAAVDKAEGVMEASIYPYPTYEQMIYHHHF
eukprot:Skav218541  [mRNA]  locus=scaffold3191:33535:41293:+ [translate_table: standard]